MNQGCDQPLYILPFDHRGSFQTKMFGWKGELNAQQTAGTLLAAAKRVIYDGFLAAIAAGVPREKAGILVDEQFGAEILRDAARDGYLFACPVEKSGQHEFDFEFGSDFRRHIETIRPTFCKVLVRYNADGDQTLNARQAARLRELSDFLRTSGSSKFMFELLVPAEAAELEELHGDQESLRSTDAKPHLMVQAIQELQGAGVEPDVWKIEGLDCREDCLKIVTAARREGRNKVGCIILGHGEDERKVGEWLTTAGGVCGFTGFAVGRTTFWDPLVDFLHKKIPRDAAVEQIGNRFTNWVQIFRASPARQLTSSPVLSDHHLIIVTFNRIAV